MEEAISAAGNWSWIEIAFDSIQLEFKNVQLYSPKFNHFDTHSSFIAIRLANNTFFKLFYNEKKDIEKDFFNLDHDFSYNLKSKNFKFQDFKLFESIKENYQFHKDLCGNSEKEIKNGEIDFLVCFITDEVAVATGGNQIQFFNEYNLLNDEEIKKLSNKWWVYWVDYWKKEKGYFEYDSACEVYPLEIDRKSKY